MEPHTFTLDAPYNINSDIKGGEKWYKLILLQIMKEYSPITVYIINQL